MKLLKNNYLKMKKRKLEDDKRKERMKIMREQLQESKIKLIQDYQERLVEGQLMKLNMQKALEEEKRNNELKEKQKKEMQKEYFDANERVWAFESSTPMFKHK